MNKEFKRVDSLFMVGFEGTRLTSRLSAFIEHYHPCGFVLFSRNIETPQQLRGLISDIRNLSEEHDNRDVMFAIDQEGGTVGRLSHPYFYLLPGAMALGRDPTGTLCEQAGFYTGRQLAGLGIQINFAPVIDINSNPFNPQLGLRSFGTDPMQVGFLGKQFAAGLFQAGVLPTAKHFPGLGDCVTDTHETLPVIDRSMNDISERELVPFNALISTQVPLVMTAHVRIAQIEEVVPATLSSFMLHGILRKKMGFNGAIITDDLLMGGISELMEPPVAALKAVQAGANIALICNSLDAAAESIRYVRYAAESGHIAQSVIEDRTAAISRLRDQCSYKTDEEVPAHGEGRELSRRIAQYAVILEGGPENVFSGAAPSRKLIIYPEARDFCAVSEQESSHETISALFHDRDDIVLARIPVDPPIELFESFREQVEDSTVIFIAYDAFKHEGQQLFAHTLSALKGQIMQIVSGNPADGNVLPATGCRVYTHGSHPCLMEEAFRVIGLYRI